MQRISPFKLMNTAFLGLPISLAYSLLSSALIYLLDGKSEAQLFLVAYNYSFKTLISLGLVLGTALVVFRSQNVIPETIEAAFTHTELAKADYFFYKQRFLSGRRSMAFAAEFAVVGFVIFYYCQFPLQGLAELLMIAPACVQYALGIYVGRKLCYAGMILHVLPGAAVTRNLSKERELDEIKAWMYTMSALAIIVVYVHFILYNGGPFLYRSVLGESVKIFLILPALIATPVLLILNFYARAVLQKLYGQSIDFGVVKAQIGMGRTLGEERLSRLEKGNASTAAKRFRVAFSFAGEKRNYVAKVAGMLAARFGEAAVLYDKFHEAEFARRDLGFYLPDLYQMESDLVIVVVCPDYRRKEWCGLEWDAIFDLLKKRKNEDIMLCRFDHALVKGLYSTAGFLELDDMTADQTATRILERLALNEGKPKDYYLSGVPAESRSPTAVRDFKAVPSPAEQ